ncbi:MAG: hypothetical protein H6719_06045 [Sandaracinaceae bacterium]|nr:hypothetical protein [Sandaracinaceae bacterium]
MADTKVEGSKALIGLAVVAVVVGLGLGLFVYLSSASESEVSGSLTIDGEAFEPAHCRSGELGEDAPRDRPEFHGVDLLTSSSGRTVRVLEDATEGPRVLVIDPGSAPRPIDRAACERFEVELRETGTLIMDVWGMEGSVDLDCPAVQGNVRFDSCYGGR